MRLCEQFGSGRQRGNILDRLVSLDAKAGLKTETRRTSWERIRLSRLAGVEPRRLLHTVAG